MGSESAVKTDVIDVCSTVLLSLTTVATAWCAYEAARWSGIQSFRLAASNLASRQASDLELEANQRLMLDFASFVPFVNALLNGDDAQTEFYRSRFSPELKPAVDAWLAEGGPKNPAAAPTPFHMKQFRLEQRTEADRHRREAHEAVLAAQTANRASDNYVLLTVIFASVLFCAGVATKFRVYKSQLAVVVFGSVVFVVTLCILLTYPVAHS